MVIVEGYSIINGIPLYDSLVDGMKICSICDYNGWGIIMKKDNEGRRIDISKIFTSKSCYCISPLKVLYDAWLFQ